MTAEEKKNRMRIVLYTISELSNTVAIRLFQVFCAWFFVQITGEEEYLANVLIAIWTVTTVFMPVSGIVLERFNKKSVLFHVSGINLLCSVSTWFFFLYGVDRAAYLFLLVVGVISSLVASILMPMATAVIPEITKDEKCIGLGFKLKSSSFLLGLVLGPVLGGYIVLFFSGIYIMLAASFFALVAVAASVRLGREKTEGEHGSKGKRGENSSLIFFKLAMILWKIPAERSLALCSCCANFLFVPFIFFLLPSYYVNHGGTVADAATIELAIGAGMLFSSVYLVQAISSVFNNHIAASSGIVFMAVFLYLFGVLEYPSVFLKILCAIGIGAGLSLFNIVVSTQRAMAIPDGYRGYMESFLLFFCTLSAPAGIYVSKKMFGVFSEIQIIECFLIFFVLAITCVCFSGSLKEMLNCKEKEHYNSNYRNLFSQ
ncbi:MAG: MFS transporter [Kistimonas sp.]|nr:MFS transporter [Kistimonas sp.]